MGIASATSTMVTVTRLLPRLMPLGMQKGSTEVGCSTESSDAGARVLAALGICNTDNPAHLEATFVSEIIWCYIFTDHNRLKISKVSEEVCPYLGTA